MTTLRRPAQSTFQSQQPVAGPSAPSRREFKRSNSDPLPPAHSQRATRPPRTQRQVPPKKSRHSLPSGLRPPPQATSRRRTRFSFPPSTTTSKRSNQAVEYMSSDSEGDGEEDDGWDLLPGQDDGSSVISEEEILAYSTPKNKLDPKIDRFIHHLERTNKTNPIERLSIDLNSFQSSYSLAQTKSSSLIEKTFLEDSVKFVQDQCGSYQVQCETNFGALEKDKEKLAGEEMREKQRKAMEMVERLQVVSAQILSNRQSTKSQLVQIATETEQGTTKEQEQFDKEVAKVSQKLINFLRGGPSSSSTKQIKPPTNTGGKRRSRKAMTSADESESQSIEKGKERKKRRKTG